MTGDVAYCWKHGDAARTVKFLEQMGLCVPPWQVDMLERMEAAAINQQFCDLVTDDELRQM